MGDESEAQKIVACMGLEEGEKLPLGVDFFRFKLQSFIFHLVRS